MKYVSSCFRYRLFEMDVDVDMDDVDSDCVYLVVCIAMKYTKVITGKMLFLIHESYCVHSSIWSLFGLSSNLWLT